MYNTYLKHITYYVNGKYFSENFTQQKMRDTETKFKALYLTNFNTFCIKAKGKVTFSPLLSRKRLTINQQTVNEKQFKCGVITVEYSRVNETNGNN